jgi:hypothetical protein
MAGFESANSVALSGLEKRVVIISISDLTKSSDNEINLPEKCYK